MKYLIAQVILWCKLIEIKWIWLRQQKLSNLIWFILTIEYIILQIWKEILNIFFPLFRLEGNNCISRWWKFIPIHKRFIPTNQKWSLFRGIKKVNSYFIGFLCLDENQTYYWKKLVTKYFRLSVLQCRMF